ncbi:MAG: glucose 1-dehydrogenase [Candidatus Dojkabacteria bacterium]
MFSLQGKVAIVTGAASGLGKEIALLFAKQGAKVVAADYDQEGLEKFLSEVPSDLTISTVKGDISKVEEVKNIFIHTQNQFGNIDIVVNNAGVMDKLDPVGSLEDEVFDRVMSINLKGTFHMMREAVNIFEKKKKGVIVNVASIAGIYGGRAGAAYTASKHGILGLTKNTAYSYSKSGIRCNAIAPGAMNTNIMKGNLDLSMAGDLIKTMLTTQGNQKIANPSEVANVALFLASDEASFVNGAIVVADGGWSSY